MEVYDLSQQTKDQKTSVDPRVLDLLQRIPGHADTSAREVTDFPVSRNQVGTVRKSASSVPITVLERPPKGPPPNGARERTVGFTYPKPRMSGRTKMAIVAAAALLAVTGYSQTNSNQLNSLIPVHDIQATTPEKPKPLHAKAPVDNKAVTPMDKTQNPGASEQAVPVPSKKSHSNPGPGAGNTPAAPNRVKQGLPVYGSYAPAKDPVKKKKPNPVNKPVGPDMTGWNYAGPGGTHANEQKDSDFGDPAVRDDPVANDADGSGLSEEAPTVVVK